MRLQYVLLNNIQKYGENIKKKNNLLINKFEMNNAYIYFGWKIPVNKNPLAEARTKSYVNMKVDDYLMVKSYNIDISISSLFYCFNNDVEDRNNHYYNYHNKYDYCNNYNYKINNYLYWPHPSHNRIITV